jgi:hypothetical protein
VFCNNIKNPSSKLKDRIVVQFFAHPKQDPGNLLIGAFRAGHRIEGIYGTQVLPGHPPRAVY